MSLIKKNDTLKEVLTGILIWWILWQIGLFIYRKDLFYNSLGLFVGIISAVFYIISLYRSIVGSLDYDEKGAMAFARKKYIFRYLAVCIVFVATALSGAGNILLCFAGILSVKTGAYMQPFVRKYIYKITDPPGEPLEEDEEEFAETDASAQNNHERGERIN
ncbi:MAG: hypothetical protein K6B28_10185 [Lachnospiraceae bacterium]|nr:hypothetical protein [Lachnospiraceae bacterium]